MLRYSFALILFLSSFLFADDLIRVQDSKGSLQERIQSIHHSATQSQFWIGYSVGRFSDSNATFMSGISINGEFRFDRNKPTLQEWINGIKIAPRSDVKDAAKSELTRLEDKKQEKIWREIGVFQKFESGKMSPLRIAVIDMILPHKFDATMYWFGNVSQEESFQYLSNQYAQYQTTGEKENLMAAISIHPPALAFPFFKKILSGKEPQQVQESAAIFTGEIGTPEALAFLQEVARTNPYHDVREGAVVGISEMGNPEALKIVSQIASSDSDKELRETAMAMLSDKQQNPIAYETLRKVAWFDSDSEMRETAIVMLAESEKSVPELLKIMEDHPSKETREIAVHMLAETIAGREVLKKKVKQ